MTKKELLDRFAHGGEERVLLARALDKLELAQGRGVPAQTPFLAPGEQAALSDLLSVWGHPRHLFWGGYPDAERRVCAFLPDWQEEDDLLSDPEGPLAALEARFPPEAGLGHRDVLGSLMGLGITRENLTGVRVVRAFGREEAETRRFQESNRELTNLQVFVGRISSLMNPLTFVLINVAAAVLIWVGAVRVDAGFLTQGAVVALLNYMSQILVELIKMANLIINISKALACANRISNVLETESTLASPVSPKASGEERGTVVFENVSLTYAGAGAPSLTNLSFRAGPGETIGIIGGTGSGKSTVVNLIPRFYDVTEGRVLVDGVDVREYDVNVLRGKIGAVMQKAVLFTGTIRENLLWGREDAGEEELWQALETAQAREFVEQKPGKLEEAVSQGGKNLSGGQKQRLTIARALVRRPEILILDDSASALDFATDAKLRKAIREMPGAPTVFLVSQRASSLQYADQIIVLDDGEAVGIGTHSELLESCEVYREIYESQFQKAGKEAAV